MTGPMDVPMFEVPDSPRTQRPSFNACNQAGPRGGFEPWVLREWPTYCTRVPVCNRRAGHDCRHRVYDIKARILAEW